MPISATTKMLRWALVCMGMLLLVPGALAQGQLTLSKNADFATSDRRYLTEDVLYLKFTAPELDAMAIEENSFELTPQGEGESVEGAFTSHEDGTFTASISLNGLEGSTAAWLLRAELEDSWGLEVGTEARIVVLGLAERAELFTVRGTVEAATGASITVAGETYQVTSSTDVRADSEVDLSALVGQPVMLRAAEQDGELVAHLIVVQDESAGRSALQLRGRLVLVPTGEIRVQDTAFEVSAATVIETEDETLLSIDDLRTELFVVVDAERAGEAWVATSITVLEENDEPEQDEWEESVEGAVDSVGTGLIVVAGQELSVGEETELEGVEELAELTIGTFVEAEFTTQPDGQKLAHKIETQEADEEDNDGADRDDEVEVTGVITSVTTDTLHVGGLAFTLTEETEVEGPRDAEITAAELYSGLEVEVKGQRTDVGLIAEEVKVESELETELEVEGVISTVSDSTVQVGDVTFLVTAETSFEGEDDVVLTLTDLAPGMTIEAKLEGRVDGSFVAVEIEVDERFEAEDVEVVGSIDAVSSSEITVSALTFTIDADTEVEGEGRAMITAADLSVGQTVKVEGEYAADSSLIATKIEVKERMHREGELTAPITAVEDDTLVVAGAAFRLAERTHVRGPQRLAELVTGDVVELDFRLLADGSRLALRLKVEDEDEGTRLKGLVDSVSAGTVYVAGIGVETTAETSLKGPDGESLTLADLTAGSTVVVEAEWTGDALVAQAIAVRRAARMAGAVEQRQDGSVRVAGQDVALTTETRVFGQGNTEFSLDDVQAGAFIEVLAVSEAPVLGKTSGSTTLIAESVQVLSAQTTTTIDEAAQVKQFTLTGNYPNPFRASTTIEFDLEEAGAVTLSVYDVLGRRVSKLVDGERQSGLHRVTWDGRSATGQDVASGVYFYQLEAGGKKETRQMLIVR